MKKLNFKGSALMQVLVLSALIVTIVVVLLKFSITRTSNMVQTKTVISAKMAVQGCMAFLNEEEIQRVNDGRLPYFEENTTYHCSYSNYIIDITRGTYNNNNTQDYAAGIVRPLNFKITLVTPTDTVEEQDIGG